MAANDDAVQLHRNHPEATHLGVDLCNKKLACPANLLLLSLNERPWDFVAEHDPLRVKLDTGPSVSFEIINHDELFPLPQHLPQFHLRPTGLTGFSC